MTASPRRRQRRAAIEGPDLEQPARLARANQLCEEHQFADRDVAIGAVGLAQHHRQPGIHQ
jgi:hypothetical protein